MVVVVVFVVVVLFVVVVVVVVVVGGVVVVVVVVVVVEEVVVAAVSSVWPGEWGPLGQSVFSLKSFIWLSLIQICIHEQHIYNIYNVLIITLGGQYMLL